MPSPTDSAVPPATQSEDHTQEEWTKWIAEVSEEEFLSSMPQLDPTAAKAVYALAKGKGGAKGGGKNQWKWNQPSQPNKGTTKGAQKGDQKGSAKGGGKGGKGGGFKGACWTCGQIGHSMNNCPQGKQVGLVGDEPFPQQPVNANVFGFCCTDVDQTHQFMTFPCIPNAEEIQTTAQLNVGNHDWMTVKPGKGNAIK